MIQKLENSVANSLTSYIPPSKQMQETDPIRSYITNLMIEGIKPIRKKHN